MHRRLRISGKGVQADHPILEHTLGHMLNLAIDPTILEPMLIATLEPAFGPISKLCLILNLTIPRFAQQPPNPGSHTPRQKSVCERRNLALHYTAHLQ